MHSRHQTIHIQNHKSCSTGQGNRRPALSQKSVDPRSDQRDVKPWHTDHMDDACGLIFLPDFPVDQTALSQKHRLHDWGALPAVFAVSAAVNLISYLRQMISQAEKRRFYRILTAVIGENAGIAERKQIAPDNTVIQKCVKFPVIGRLSEDADPSSDPHCGALAGPLFLQLGLLFYHTQYFVPSSDLECPLLGDLWLKGDIFQRHPDVLLPSRIPDSVFLFCHSPPERNISSLRLFSDRRLWRRDQHSCP